MSPVRRAWNTLHARLLAGAVLWIVAALAISDMAISAFFRHQVTGQFMHELTDHISEIEALTSIGPDGRPHLRHALSDPRFLAQGSGFYWQVVTPGGAVLKSPSLGEDALHLTMGAAPPDPYLSRRERAGDPVYIIERPTPEGTAQVAVGVEADQLKAVLAQFDWVLRASLAVLAAGLIAAAAAQVAFGLRPMRRLRQQLSAVRSGEAERLPDDFPQEVRPLVHDLNQMIGANQEMVRRARTQAGNLAHALKGPLAVLVDEAERLSDRGDDASARLLLQQCEAMRRQIDHQIARARAAAARAGPGAHVRPAGAAGMIISALGRLHAARGLAFENELQPALALACDPDDLNEMLANLVDNAAKWAASRVRLSDRPAARPGYAEIVVEDDGPGVPSDKREAVFGVGERLDEQKPGSGLGLAIVRELAELYGGRAGLEVSRLGGAAAVLELPLARP
jgi:signal transduction histidine kinase